MLEISRDLLAWLRQGHRVAVATIVAVHGSAPRPAGTSMAVRDDGAVLGSLTGGCVEAQVHEACLAVLAGAPAHVLGRAASGPDGQGGEAGRPADDVLDLFSPAPPAASDLLGLGSLTDDLAMGVTCGGRLEVLVRLLDDSPDALHQLERAAEGMSARLGVVVDGPATGVDHGRAPAGASVFWEERDAAPRLVLLGATAEAAALCALGAGAGWAVTVCDPRPVFCTKDRFPEATHVVVGWPQVVLPTLGLGARDALCVMAHDERYDTDALGIALRAGTGFVGAMASRRTRERRAARLLADGADPADVARVRSPLGLDVGARTAGELAVSVLAEILATRAGTGAHPLSA